MSRKPEKKLERKVQHEEAPVERPAAKPQCRCPVCYTGFGGVGTMYSKHGNTGYYKCGKCGHTWTAVVRIESVKVEHRVVNIETRKE